MTCGRENYGLVGQTGLEHDVSALLLRTMAVGMKQQFESAEVALDME